MAELISLVPAAHRSQPEVASALGHLARRRGDLEAAEQWARAGVEEATEVWPELQVLLGEVLLQKTVDNGLPPGLFQLDADRKSALQTAVQAFTKAWDALKEDDLRAVRSDWLISRSLAYLLLGQKKAAQSDIDEALRLRPGELLYNERYALLLLDRGDVAGATRLLNGLLPCPEHPSVYVTLASVLCEGGQYSEAEAVIDQCPTDGISPTLREDLHYLRIRSAVGREDWDGAERGIEAMRRDHPESLRVLIEEAHLARQRGDRGGSLRHLGDAKARLTLDASPVLVYALATEYYALKEYREAADLYELITNPSVFGPLTERLIKAHYHAGDLNRALRLGQDLLSLHGPLPLVSEMVAAIYADIGDLSAARQIATTYLALHPNDFSMRLRHASVCLRSRDAAGIDAFLDTPIDLAVLTLEQSQRVAQLYHYRKRAKEALDVAYETRRRYYTDSMAHLFYVSLYFHIEPNVRETWLRPTVAAIDTAVSVLDAAGRDECYVIEARVDHRLPDELPIDHPLARKLLGKSIGESIVLTESPYSAELGAISGLKSKYVHALHDSLHTFERLFPGTPGLWGINLQQPGEEGDRSMQPVLDAVSERHEYAQEVLKLYQQGQITLGILAKLLGTDTVNAWSMASGYPDVGIRCSRGSSDELRAAQCLLTAGTTLILDVIGLLTLYSLGSRDQIAARYGPFGIAQSSIDHLMEVLLERRSVQSRGFLILGKERNAFVRQEISPEDIQRHVAYLEALVQWVDENCDVRPVNPERKQPRYDRLEEMMHPSFVDTLLIAAEDGRVLYTDDERLRALAHGEVGKAGVWTQVLLAKAQNDRVIDSDTYCREVIQLACMNYHHTHISPDVIFAAARQSEWHTRYPFTGIIDVLSGGNCEERSAVTVVAETMARIARETLMAHQRTFLYDALLRKLLTNRHPQRVLYQLRQRLRPYFRLMPIQEQEVLLVIDSWTRANLI